jgi:glycosyltransferase involved in cell wall biosynthesis
MIKVALVSFGFADYCIPLANGLAECAHVTYFYGQKDSRVKFNSLYANVSLREFNEPRIRQVGPQIKCMLRLVTNIRKLKPNVIHLQQGHPWFNLIALPLLKHYPLVCTIHDVIPHPGDKLSAKYPYWMQLRGFYQAHQVIVHGQSLKVAAQRALGLPAARVNAVPMVANTTVPLTNDAPSFTKSTKDILFFGRIFEYKGLRYLIEAEPLITARVPEVRIIIAGKGDDLAEYRRQMINPDRFVIHDHYITNEEMGTLFAEADLVVLPYIEASQSGVVPVAYRFGKAVVASRVGGLPDLVDDGQTGLLVPPRDVHGLASAIIRLLQDDPLRQAMGRAGHSKMETECSPRAVAHLTTAVYQKAIAQTATQAIAPRSSEVTP